MSPSEPLSLEGWPIREVEVETPEDEDGDSSLMPGEGISSEPGSRCPTPVEGREETSSPVLAAFEPAPA